MEPIGIAEPEQLAALREALDRYCDARHITNDQERKNLACIIMDLFGRGLTSTEEIVSALEEMGRQPTSVGRVGTGIRGCPLGQ